MAGRKPSPRRRREQAEPVAAPEAEEQVAAIAANDPGTPERVLDPDCLIVTSGDIAARLLREAGIADPERLAIWRDVLHEGPVPNVQSLATLADIRATWLSAAHALPLAEVRASFAERDALIADHARHARIELWLEHDLYDQLQLLQILASLAAHGRTQDIVLVQADAHLGEEQAGSIARFAAMASPLPEDAVAEAARLWRAVTSHTPEALVEARAAVPEAFPFLEPALNRWLGELPDPDVGVTATERLILLAIDEEAVSAKELFQRVNAADDPAFLGDWSFFRALDGLRFCDKPLVAMEAGRYPGGPAEQDAAYLDARPVLTEAGRAALHGAFDHAAANGIERWWGGVRLSRLHDWRWDAREDRLSRRAPD